MSEEHMVPLYHLELVREKNLPYKSVKKREQVVEVFHEMLDSANVEKVAVIHCNSGLDMIGSEMVAIGSMESVRAEMADLFRGAVRNNAAAIWIAHNHVDGRVQASMPDYRFTMKVLDASELLGIPLVDHYVIGEGAHYSIYQNREALHKASRQLEMEAMKSRLLELLPAPSGKTPAPWDMGWKDPLNFLI